MHLIQEFAPYFVAMLILIAGSGFFSSSEAALFSLQSDDRRKLKEGNLSQQAALHLLTRPDRLLMAILFWNLIINIVYFALASVVSIQLEQQQRRAEAGLVAFLSLLVIILCSEMVPKTVGVLMPRGVASLIGIPLSAAVRLFEPLSPLFSSVDAAMQRLIFPNFVEESYLALSDLEQAITVSTPDEELAAQERFALQNIVLLSDLTAEEMMRPRKQYQSFAPPVNLEDLGGQITRSGYLLVTEPDSDEITGAIGLRHLPTISRSNLEKFAKPVVYVPWCSTVASVFDELQNQQQEVAAIINEFGETIGIVTLEDLLEHIFEDETSRSSRLLETSAITALGDGAWQVTGMTTLRRLCRHFDIQLPSTKSTTVTGIVQEKLGRLPEVADVVEWETFRIQVTEAEEYGNIMVRLSLLDLEEHQS